MLQELSIRAFALIDEVELTFGAGMTCLVGETGAGKSILVDALAAALGSRMSSDLLRPGSRKAVIEASFDVASLPSIRTILQEHDLDWEEPRLIMRRELTASGTSRCFINDTPSTTAVARSIAEHLMDFHGQHDTYGLLDVHQHVTILDTTADHADDLTAMRQAWENLRAADEDLKRLEKAALSADEERARLEFIIREIDEVDPQPNEDAQIMEELRRSESREQIVTAASAAREALYAGEHAAYERLIEARDQVRALLPFEPSLDSLLAELESAITSCKEGAVAVSELTDLDDFSPEHLEELRQRLRALQRLIKKYGDLSHAVSIRDERRVEFEQLSDLDAALSAAHKRVSTSRAHAQVVAKKIRRTRRTSAPTLAERITATLRDLGMPSAEVKIDVADADLGPTGIDRVEILFSANAGEVPKPLARIASGGELSRFMLALKKAQVQDATVGSMVFDEIDTGISGKVARQVGLEMLHLAGRHQVICITHLPQIASLAHTMIRVEKHEQDNRSTITAAAIGREDMIQEVARLMSGTEVSEATLKGAQELMNNPAGGSS